MTGRNLSGLFCDREGHRRRRGDAVVVERLSLDGTVGTFMQHGLVLSEGFDLHDEHVGWVVFPRQDGRPAKLAWMTLCRLADGDAAIAAGDGEHYELDVTTGRFRVRGGDVFAAYAGPGELKLVPDDRN